MERRSCRVCLLLRESVVSNRNSKRDEDGNVSRLRMGRNRRRVSAAEGPSAIRNVVLKEGNMVKATDSADGVRGAKVNFSVPTFDNIRHDNVDCLDRVDETEDSRRQDCPFTTIDLNCVLDPKELREPPLRLPLDVIVDPDYEVIGSGTGDLEDPGERDVLADIRSAFDALPPALPTEL